MKTIELKTDPIPFQASMEGLKPYEIRYNDRDYQVDDEIILKETKFTEEQMRKDPRHFPLVYTGRELVREVAHVLSGAQYGLLEGYVCLTLSDPSLTGYKALAEQNAKSCIERDKRIRVMQRQIDLLDQRLLEKEIPQTGKPSVYHKPCPNCGGMIDVYDLLDRMFHPIPHTIGHAIKKLLVLGKRSGGKSAVHDAQDAIWSVNRWIEMQPKQ